MSPSTIQDQYVEGQIAGWDVGGAHLKVACISSHGGICHIAQHACPLWQGIEHLHRAVTVALSEFRHMPSLHAVTMTGELADIFDTRANGVEQIAALMTKFIPHSQLRIYTVKSGFIRPSQCSSHSSQIASANWHATVSLAARKLKQGIVVDVGSTTTDILPFDTGIPLTIGETDYERLRHEELIYTGVVRTAVNTISSCAPYDGAWVTLMNEQFATTADVYRLTNELPDYADMHPTADGCGKSMQESARRLARLFGLDVKHASLDLWKQLASYFARRQLHLIQTGCERVLSRVDIDTDAPIVGAGVGRFLVIKLAHALNRRYVDFHEILKIDESYSGNIEISDCAAAIAVAQLVSSGIAR